MDDYKERPPVGTYSDNVWVRRSKDGSNQYFQITVEPHEVSFTRYVVPGRYDIYNFTWKSSNMQGLGSRVSMFSDKDLSLQNALRHLKNDLNNSRVKRLIEEAKESSKIGFSKYLIKILLKKVS